MSSVKEPHRPVMVNQLLYTLDLKQSNTVIDATYGFGGHADHVLDVLGKKGRLVGIERDPLVHVLAGRQISDSRVKLLNESYRRIGEICSMLSVVPNAVYFDLGVSSYHLDESPRGFSYKHRDEPFDCRFNPSEAVPKASDVLNECSGEELQSILAEFGEVRRLPAVRERLLEARPVSTVGEVVDALEDVLRPDEKYGELARVFQAFRIRVNDELSHLEEGLEAAVEVLSKGGRLAVITYHSLEDRIVKHFLRHEARECVCPPDLPACACDKVKRLQIRSNSPLSPSGEEVERNPRARSAKLRSAIKYQ